MKIDSLKIISKYYKVKYIDAMNDKLDGGSTSGKINSRSAVIYIANDLSNGGTAQILLHEVIHGIEYELGDVFELDETHVSLLAPMLMAVLKDNPKLVKLIMMD